MQGPVGQGRQTPEEGVATGVVDRCLAGRELDELFDPMLDHGASIVGASGGHGVDARNVGQHVGLEPDLVGVQIEPVALRAPLPPERCLRLCWSGATGGQLL